eukprot:4088304-Amphidinium_carterae.1
MKGRCKLWKDATQPNYSPWDQPSLADPTVRKYYTPKAYKSKAVVRKGQEASKSTFCQSWFQGWGSHQT